MSLLRPGCVGVRPGAHTHKMHTQSLDQTCQGQERPALPGILEDDSGGAKITGKECDHAGENRYMACELCEDERLEEDINEDGRCPTCEEREEKNENGI